MRMSPNSAQYKRGIWSFLTENVSSIAVIPLALLLLLPIFGVLFGAFGADDDVWSHLSATVMPDYIGNTLVLLCIVAVLTGTIGTGAAWIIAATEFPGRKWLDSLLILPIAAPAYIIAYVYTDLLEFAGPVQSYIRALTGWQHGDYWFPQIRTIWGAGIMLSLVLYPYVYLAARASFMHHSQTRFAAARSLGASPWRAFFRVSLPAAIPAILGGMMLALMETAADFGVADYFGVTTFSTGIFRAWYGLGSEVSALRLAGMLMLIVGLLVFIERSVRSTDGVGHSARDSIGHRMKLSPALGILAIIACLIPVLTGFAIPVGTLLHMSISSSSLSFDGFLTAASNSINLSLITAVLTFVIAMFFAYAQRQRNRTDRRFVNLIAIRTSSLGYALPGTLLAVGLLLPLTAIDKPISLWVRNNFDLGLGLILTGSVIALVYAYVIRFLTVAFNTMEPAVSQLPRNMDEAARTLGAKGFKIARLIHLPRLFPAFCAAILLVFIDTMRELPATLLLRPFNFETLATRIYRLASDERLAEASTSAIAIVLIGLVPVLLLNRASQR